jgi:nitric oxide dioxygenase
MHLGCIKGEGPVQRILSPENAAIVKSTSPALQQHGLAITTRMYERLFVDADIKQMFDMAAQESGEQPRRLANAILAYAQNIDRLQALAAPVQRMATRHFECGVKAEHYPYVANALLPAIEDVLGAAATPEVIAAWGEAYWVLADILIAAEDALYAEAAAGRAS